MKVSVVILTWNSLPAIEACLASLPDSVMVSHDLHDVIVVDNGSQDQTLEVLRSRFPLRSGD